MRSFQALGEAIEAAPTDQILDLDHVERPVQEQCDDVEVARGETLRSDPLAQLPIAGPWRDRHRRRPVGGVGPGGIEPVDLALSVHGEGRTWTIVCDLARIDRSAIARDLGAAAVEETPASLDEIFVAHTGAARAASGGPPPVG